ncbi:MAG: hypothetical protein Q9160_000904 [Pyrenula sp. 1 TL-2023]
MDIDRIKHNFRIRSGRLKRSKKSVNDHNHEGDITGENGALLNGTNGLGRPEQVPEVPPKDLPGDDGTLPLNPTPQLDPIYPGVTWSQVPSSRIPPRSQTATSERSRDIERSYAQLNAYSGQRMARSQSQEESSSGEEKDYVLHPPPPNKPLHTIDGTSDLETQKAIKAVEYANAIALNSTALPRDDNVIPRAAASLDPRFHQRSQKAVEMLVMDAMPAYITYTLVKVVTEVMVKEITGTTQIPIMQGLIEGLTEVFCLTDPSQKENPIIYASDHFYRMTGYGRDYSIGRNCRFLQGPKTRQSSIARLKQAITQGQEISETFLNYRRDGTPFINLLMIAPLHDDKGNVRYYIGAQVDVTGLVEDGRGLDGFDRLLQHETAHAAAGALQNAKTRKGRKTDRKDALGKLRELSEMFDLEESAIVQSHSRSNSMTRDDDSSIGSVHHHRKHGPQTRRNLVESAIMDDDEIDERERASWTLSTSSLSGRLPGVYQNYLLLRPSSSLRIIFVSPSLRKMGNMLQTPFFSHISSSASVLSGLKESFDSVTPVTANVSWRTTSIKRPRTRDQHSTAADGQNGNVVDESLGPRACWISATPLLGSDDQVGIWMVLLIERPSTNTTSMIPSRLTSRPPVISNHVSPPASRKRNKETKTTNHSNDAAGSSESNSDEFVRKAVPVSMSKPERVLINGSPRPSETSAFDLRNSVDDGNSHLDHGRRSYDSGSRQVNGKTFPVPRSRASRRPSSVAEQSEGEVSHRSASRLAGQQDHLTRGPDSPTTGSSQQERLRISDPSTEGRNSTSL